MTCRGACRAVEALWSDPIRAEPLALFRILLALTLLASQLTGLAGRLDLLEPGSPCPGEACDDWLASQYRLCLLRLPAGAPVPATWLPQGLVEWSARPSTPRLLYALFLLSLITLALGLFTRLSALAAVVLAATFFNRLPWLMNGGDSLARNGLYFLVLAPAGAVWSVDSWWRGCPGPALIAPWSVRLMQIQLAVMYFCAGLVKFGWDYLTGEAVYWVLNDLTLARWPYARVPVPLLACRLLSWGTVLFEVGFPFLVLSARLRPWLLLAGVMLHLGVLATMEIGWFSQVTLCWYVLFVPGERLAALIGPRLTTLAGRSA